MRTLAPEFTRINDGHLPTRFGQVISARCANDATANNHHMGSKAGFFRHMSEGQRGFLNKKNEKKYRETIEKLGVTSKEWENTGVMLNLEIPTPPKQKDTNL